VIKIGILSFFKRKKKEEEILPNLEPNLKPVNEFRSFQPSINETSQDYNAQLIIAKLDLINSRLQNIEQKIALIEQIAKESQEPQQKWQQRKAY